MLASDQRQVLRAVASDYGVAYELVGRFVGGTHGAYELASPGGCGAVLKLGRGSRYRLRVQQAPSIVTRLREVGYPVPQLLYSGEVPAEHESASDPQDAVSYVIHELVRGQPIEHLTSESLDLLLALNDLQRGLGTPLYQDWSGYVWRVVFAGESGWAETLRSHSPDSARLLDAVQRVAEQHAAVELPTDDFVHGDFLPVNVLVEDGRVSAVIDVEYAGRGTRAIDLSRLLVWRWFELDAAGRGRVWDRLGRALSPGGTIVCVVEQIIDRVAYAAEQRGADEVSRVLPDCWQIVGELQSLPSRKER